MAKRKRSLLEVVNPFDEESKARRAESRARRAGRKAGRKAAKATEGMVGFESGARTKTRTKPVKGLTSRSRAKKLGAAKGTKVRKGAIGVEKTKGGDYVKYQKGSKSARKFSAAFKKGCAGGAKSFTWDGRKYSCKKK